MGIYTIFDPDLLVYSYEEWLEDNTSCRSRFQHLQSHLYSIDEFNFRIAFTDPYLAVFISSFPWQEEYRTIPELRDLQSIMMIDIERRRLHIEERYAANSIVIVEEGLICCIASDEISDSFLQCLYNCTQRVNDEELLLGIMGYPHNNCEERCEVKIIVEHDLQGLDNAEYSFLLIRNESDLISHLFELKLERWDDLALSLDLFGILHTELTQMGRRAERPLSIRFEDGFLASVYTDCTTRRMRLALLNALLSIQYDIENNSLVYERGVHTSRGLMDRFRTGYRRRVHCTRDDNELVLCSYGRGHRLDNIG